MIMKKRLLASLLVLVFVFSCMPVYAADIDGTLVSATSGQGHTLTPLYNDQGNLIGSITETGEKILFSDDTKTKNPKPIKEKPSDGVTPNYFSTGYTYNGMGGQTYGTKNYTDAFNYSTVSVESSITFTVGATTTSTIAVEASFPTIFKTNVGIDYAKNWSLTQIVKVPVPPKTQYRLYYAPDLQIYNWTDNNLVTPDVDFQVKRPLSTKSTWSYTYPIK